MATELGLLSLTQLQKLALSQQQQLNPSLFAGSSMWNPKQSAAPEEDDSWEERAFAEDTGNIMGTTWPPRSYTCTFCRREFRSAQALGGHMNVHRRDRAQLHQMPAGTSNNPTSSSSTASSSLIIPAQELVANGGLCFLYSLPNPNGIFPPTAMNACIDSSSTLLSISPYLPNNLMPPRPPSINFPVAPPSINSAVCHSSNSPSASIDKDKNHNNSIKESAATEELDLELRLGCSSSPS